MNSYGYGGYNQPQGYGGYGGYKPQRYGGYSDPKEYKKPYGYSDPYAPPAPTEETTEEEVEGETEAPATYEGWFYLTFFSYPVYYGHFRFEHTIYFDF